MGEIFYDWIDSPIGTIAFVVGGGMLRAVEIADDADTALARAGSRYGAMERNYGTFAHDVRDRLEAYFRGDLTAIDGITVGADGTTFQKSVWQSLRAIPAGTTTTYGAIAVSVGTPLAVRAVGAANGANPIPIVVPCHRVIGANGSLTGYGGGLARKEWLLRHEGALLL